MKTAVVLLLLLAVVACCPPAFGNTAAYLALFRQWMTQYGKTYTPVELVRRFRIFRDNADCVYEHNKKGATFSLALNEFADLTNSEFRSLYVGQEVAPPPPPPGAESRVALETDPPATDWITAGGPVENGQNCAASGYAFATTGAIDAVAKIVKGVTTASSEEQTLICSSSLIYGNGLCSSGSVTNALNFVVTNNGLYLASKYGWTAKHNTACKTGTGGNTYADVNNYTNDMGYSPDALTLAVYNHGPVAVLVDASTSSFSAYDGGIFPDPLHSPAETCSNTSLSHWVLLVGFGTTAGGTMFWRIKNSWGSGWGESSTGVPSGGGYMRLLRQQGTYNPGSCGIATAGVYPWY